VQLIYRSKLFTLNEMLSVSRVLRNFSDQFVCVCIYIYFCMLSQFFSDDTTYMRFPIMPVHKELARHLEM